MTDPLAAALSPDEASDLILALSEMIDQRGKFPRDDDDQQQVNRWQALQERIEQAGDWEVA